MTLKEIVEAIRDCMSASFCVNAQVEEKAKQALEDLLREYDWHPIYGDGGEDLPELDEDGYSEKVLVSFGNCSLPDIGEYRQEEDGGGSFYVGDLTDKFSDYGLIVNAWRPLPDPYREDDQ